MDIFEYLPQLIVAYDGNDEFANLIHVKKANKDNDYYCPCCGGTVKPRALESEKEQSHYYHITGRCTKESQLHFFCKNWLFESGSKFYIDNQLFEVESIDIEKVWHTKFGDYRPDVTVYTTSGNSIFFEMFFTNRKTGDDYFCKWNDLDNDVVEVNVKEYLYKTDEDSIPSFTYLYHDGKCYSKPYLKRDLYANTIAKIKRELTRQKVLNYKARIEQLDWFWQKIRNNDSVEAILSVIESMEYDDMVSCYEIIKRKQCMSHLRNTVLTTINKKIIADVRNSLNLPKNENVYFDLRQIHGRTYESGIRLKIKTEHISYDDFYMHCEHGYNLEKCKAYPKFVFNKNILAPHELAVPEDKKEELKNIFNYTIAYKNDLIKYESILSAFEGDNYKVRFKNGYCTVLAKVHNDDFETVLLNYHMERLDEQYLSCLVQEKIKEIKDAEFFNQYIKSAECEEIISGLKNYREIKNMRVNIYHAKESHYEKSGIYVRLFLHNNEIYKKMIFPSVNQFIAAIRECEKCIDNHIDPPPVIHDIIEKINHCPTKFWKARFRLNHKNLLPEIKIDQKIIGSSKYHFTYEIVELYNHHGIVILEEKEIIKELEKGMHKVLKNMEEYGYRILEVQS